VKKLAVLVVAAVTTVAAGIGAVTFHGSTASAEHPADIVGAWEVTAVAPYAPHLFTFNEDGTMLTTNPTNVQESPARPHGGTNDSVGMGTWKVVKDHGDRYVVGTFEQLNAFADNHQPADKLLVSFKVKVQNNGNGFDGPAAATVGSETDPSHLTGTRIHVDQAAVDAL
jgi:hypothetical protein